MTSKIKTKPQLNKMDNQIKMKSWLEKMVNQVIQIVMRKNNHLETIKKLENHLKLKNNIDTLKNKEDQKEKKIIYKLMSMVTGQKTSSSLLKNHISSAF